MQQFPRKGTRYRIYQLKGQGGTVTHGVQRCTKLAVKARKMFVLQPFYSAVDEIAVSCVYFQRTASWEAMLVFGLGDV